MVMPTFTDVKIVIVVMQRSVSPYSNSESELSDNDKRRVLTEGGDGKTFELFEPFSPVNSPDHLFELSDEDIMPSKRVNLW